MIPFNKPANTGNEEQFVIEAINSGKLSGDGSFTKKCQLWFEETLPCEKALLTPSCTHALEMAAILIGIKEGDEVIMPSYTFVSTANAFALRGAKIVFIDIRPDTLNINEALIESAINQRTKAIVPVHYAGISCEMDTIMRLAEKYNLFVIEDAAQGMMNFYKRKALGTIGHMGAFSFHETKNYTSGGEGGVLLINDESLIDRAEIIREKGTNRNQFFRGVVDKYSWVDIGSSYLPSELQSAYLWGQLEKSTEIKNKRISVWNQYYQDLKILKESGQVQLPLIPKNCTNNGHIFYLKLKDLSQRTKFIEYLKNKNILSTFHYVPLHSSKAGIDFGNFHGEDIYTTKESERLVRLPLFFNITEEEISKVTSSVLDFFK
jgi:dTDP-4-amino-4,6-dideoxygalactose transaminase